MKRHLFTLLLACGTVLNAHAITYEVIDLGTTDGGRTSGAHGLNRDGVAVGWSRVDRNQRACAFHGSGVVDLGTLGGSSSYALAINARGDVVGWAQNVDYMARAYLYRNGTMKELGTLGGNYSEATSLNNVGQVVGWASTAAGDLHAFVWKEGQMADLGTLGGSRSYAFDINGSGQIVGASETVPGSYDAQAFVYEQGVMVGLGTLGGPESSASGINNLGEIVGSADRADGTNAPFLFRDGVMHDLGAPWPGASCLATSINEHSEVVGFCHSGPFVYRHGKLRMLEKMLDPVSSAGWSLRQAYDINQDGEIVGIGRLDGKARAYKLRPMQR